MVVAVRPRAQNRTLVQFGHVQKFQDQLQTKRILENDLLPRNEPGRLVVVRARKTSNKPKWQRAKPINKLG